jgi:hypothetical protein
VRNGSRTFILTWFLLVPVEASASSATDSLLDSIKNASDARSNALSSFEFDFSATVEGPPGENADGGSNYNYEFFGSYAWSEGKHALEVKGFGDPRGKSTSVSVSDGSGAAFRRVQHFSTPAHSTFWNHVVVSGDPHWNGRRTHSFFETIRRLAVESIWEGATEGFLRIAEAEEIEIDGKPFYKVTAESVQGGGRSITAWYSITHGLLPTKAQVRNNGEIIESFKAERIVAREIDGNTIFFPLQFKDTYAFTEEKTLTDTWKIEEASLRVNHEIPEDRFQIEIQPIDRVYDADLDMVVKETGQSIDREQVSENVREILVEGQGGLSSSPAESASSASTHSTSASAQSNQAGGQPSPKNGNSASAHWASIGAILSVAALVVVVLIVWRKSGSLVAH